MSTDIQHQSLKYTPSKLEHHYGDNVHILANPYLQTMLAKLGRADTLQPLINTYITTLYRALLREVINCTFSRQNIEWETRMHSLNSEAVFGGEIIKEDLKVICVDLARAGQLPAHLCFDELNYLLAPENLRQDHIYLNRKVDKDGVVVGVDVSGSKIGGGKQDSVVLFPDPMGATGGSLSYAVSHYKEKVKGNATKFIALHLVITPEYVARMSKDHPDLEIFSIRLDRGLSSSEVLKSTPGTHKDQEKGLNDIQYIVPGLGGVGEIINNSFV
ncbi:MAG: uracil phosphoribosyltransferase [Bacteriovoracaceae bacterium]|nr:uracil phosphoribosyltransferase [Bacteriovoracaceae bacterium]